MDNNPRNQRKCGFYSNKIMKIAERILYFLDSQNIKPSPFENKIGVSRGYFNKMVKRNADIGEGTILKIVEYCPQVNLSWLILGTGEMLKNEVQKAEGLPEILDYLREREVEIKNLNREIGRMEERLESSKKTVARPEENVICADAVGSGISK